MFIKLYSDIRTFSISEYKFRLIKNGKERKSKMITYTPLFRTMAEKNITSYALFQQGFSKATYHSIRKGNSVSVNTVNQLCKLLDCSVSDIIEYVDTDM